MCGLSAFLSFDLFLRIVIRRQTLDYYVTSVIAKFPLYIYLQIGVMMIFVPAHHD